jgi:hypothetical protein
MIFEALYNLFKYSYKLLIFIFELITTFLVLILGGLA